MDIKDVFSFLRKDTEDLMFWKDKATGDLRFLCGYSSNYIDDDNPPDILSAKAHRDFADKVNKGILPYPTFRLWHIKGTDIGVTDYVFYDEQYGIAMATGTIELQYEHIAKALQKSKEELGVSHGMERITRSEKDKKVIDEYVTIEISVLPLVAAANKMTSIIIKENSNMTISTEQKEFLRGKGLSDGLIAALDAKNKNLSEENTERLRKSKEKEAAVVGEETPETEAADVVAAEDTKAEETPAEGEAPAENVVPAEDIVPAEEPIKSTDTSFVTMQQMESTVEYLVKTISERLDAMSAAVEVLTSKSTELEKSVNDGTLTPGASLGRIIHEGLISKSIKTAPEKGADNEDPLLKDAPAEAEAATDEPLSLAGSIQRIVGKN